MKDLREEFRQNKKPDLCKTCWVDEENNRKSKRLTYNNEVYESLKEVDINWREEPGIPFEYQMIIVIFDKINLFTFSTGREALFIWSIEV